MEGTSGSLSLRNGLVTTRFFFLITVTTRSGSAAQHPAESKCLEIIHKSPFQRLEMVAGQNQEMVTWTFVVGTGNSGVPHPDL